MKFIITTLLLISSTTLFAQNRIPLYNRALQLQIDHSYTGDGDIPGYAFNVTYKGYFHRHFYWNAGIGANLYNGEEYNYHNDLQTIRVESLIKYTTGGMQLTGGAGYSIIRNRHSELEIRLNALARYQVSSSGHRVDVIPPGPSSSYPTVEIFKVEPVKTVSAGYLVQAGYNYSITPEWYIGIAGSFQNDTEGTLIAEYGLTIGRRL